MKKAETLG